MRTLFSQILAVSVMTTGWTTSVLAQDEEDESETIAEFTEGFDQVEGLFPLYIDPEDGSVYMEISEGQLGEEFIYFLYTENGTPSVGHFRGNFRSNRVMSLHKRYGQIEIAAENTAFEFDENNALSNAAEANITRAPLVITDIEAESEDGTRYLINATSIFTSEDLHQVKPSSFPGQQPGQSFTLGSLDSGLTRVVEARSYPENTDIIVEYVYKNDSPINFGDPSITDPRSVAITTQHTFIEMPENDYEPRADDFRVGYFGERVTNLTDTSVTPYADVINRWHLVKQDPDAEVSDPVEPIVFWIENTTPVELRDVITEGALAWNEAFEAAGFSNAVQVRIQPDDADWDAGDIRYNVLRWTSSPTPPFGGYGPNFSNPRTGQILGADIMLEYVFLTNRVRQSEIFDAAGMPAWVQDALAEYHGESAHDGHLHPEQSNEFLCNYADFLQREVMTAMTMLQVQGASEIEMNRLVEETLKLLILHEIGHTLGLNHNMAASYAVPLDELHSGRLTTNSVMDYGPTNLAPNGVEQGAYDTYAAGPYDIWAIQYGYTPDESELPAILARSTDPELIFGNDADDMRAPGRHIDPRVMISDLSDDPVSWAEQRVELMNATLAELPEAAINDGETYQDLYTRYLILTGQRFSAANVASRHVGGIYNYRSEIGQEGAQTPFQPVPRALQEEALSVVANSLFAPDAFAVEESFADMLQRQRRFFDHGGTDEDPSLHARALGQQLAVMAHLTHPNVLERMTDARAYGGDYPVAEYMQDLTGYVFDEDIKGNPNTYRQNLQVAYTNRLIAIASGADGFDSVSRSAALASINDIKAMVAPAWFGMESGSREARAHRAHIRALIDAFED